MPVASGNLERSKQPEWTLPPNSDKRRASKRYWRQRAVSTPCCTTVLLPNHHVYSTPAADGGAWNDRVRRVQVLVRDNNVDQALRALKKKLQREGVFREMKLRGHYEKPSVKKAREKAEAVRRARKLARKRAQREGLVPGRTTH